jgi:HK97 family phage portal protein
MSHTAAGGGWSRRLKEAWSTVDNWIFRRWRNIAGVLGAGGEPSYTGKSIDEVRALNSSTVYACARIIADPVGMLPLHLYERLGDDERRRATADPLYRLLRHAPNRFTAAINFRQTVQMFALLWGNGYARIIRRSGRDEVLGFRVLHPGAVTPKDGDNGPVYEVRNKNGPAEVLDFRDVLHIPGLGFDGIKGESVIRLGANTIGLDLASLEYGGKFFARGGRVPYLLKHAQRFKTDQEREKFLADWDKAYGGPEGYSKGVLLEGGLEYQQIGFKPEDAQLLSTRLFAVGEICRWFLVNPYKVGDGRHATLNNVEHLGIEFLQTCLGYWLEVWTQQIWLRVLSERQQEQGLYVEFDTNKLQQGDFQTRMQGYATAKTNGWMNADQICARENLPKLPNGAGAAYHIQGAMVTVPGTGEPTAFERATLARANAKPPSGGANAA